MNTMLQLNLKIVKKLRAEIDNKLTGDSITERDMLWINELSGRGIITPIRNLNRKY